MKALLIVLALLAPVPVSVGYQQYQGIPYAQAERFGAPRLLPAGVAAKPGVQCRQRGGGEEDCLVLNVTAPRTPGRKPVLVWLHGGGFVEGAGAEYDPRRMVVRGNVVVVTVNYRLGIFGNLAFPGLDGSFGLQDQQAALKWVRRNISGFGGDPGNVTLFGQSAGGQSVCAHLASPAAKGLFHRAIVQSSLCTTKIPANAIALGLPAVSPWEEPAAAAARGVEIAAKLDCRDVACLRGRPVERLMAEFTQFAGLSYGSTTLPENPFDVFREGRAHRMPMLSGTTRDEATYSQALIDIVRGRGVTDEEYARYRTEAFGVRADEVARRYTGVTPSHAWARVVTDSAFACPTLARNRLFSQHMPTFAYEFADRTAPPTLPDVGYPYGAYHSAEALYLFEGSLNAEQRRLADMMITAWTSFARTGDPGWPRFPAVRSLRHDVGFVDIAEEHQCGFWASEPKEHH